MSAGRWLALVALVAGCDRGALVTVRGRPALTMPSTLRVTIDGPGGRVSEDLAIPGGATLPLTFAVDTTGRDGEASLTIDGVADGLLVGRGAGSLPLGTDAEVAVTLEPADRVATRSQIAGDQRLVAVDRPYGARQLAASDDRVLLGFESGGSTWARLFDGLGHPVVNAATRSDGELEVPPAIDGGTVAVAASTDSFAVVWQPARDGPSGPRTILALATYRPDDAARISIGDNGLGDDGSGSARLPAVAGLADGRHAVAWLAAADRAASSGEVRLALVDRAAIAAGAPVAVGEGERTGLGAPALAGLGDGGLVVVWSVPRAGGASRLLGRVFDGTRPRTAALELDAPATPDAVRQEEPQVAALPDGGFVVAWAEGRGGVATVRARWFDPSGAARGPAVQVAEIPPRNQTPALIASASLGVIVAWSDGPEVDTDVRYRAYRLDGTPLGEARPLATTIGGVQRQPSLAAQGEAFVAAWTDESMTAPDGDGAAVRLRVVYPRAP